MKTLKIFSLAALALLTQSLNAQEDAAATTSAPEAKNTNGYTWSIGLSGAVIDDDGDPFTNLFNVGNSWHFLPFPTRVHVDMAIDPNWSFEAAVTYNMLQSGKVVNDRVLTEDHMFVAFDVNAKYHFLGESEIFDPYGVGGLGFTYRSALENQTPTLNLGVGTNIWFIPSFGLNLQTTAKVKIIGASSNYLMHSAGIVYRFGK